MCFVMSAVLSVSGSLSKLFICVRIVVRSAVVCVRSIVHMLCTCR